MSRSIEERVVSMQFDNAQFEKNLGGTLGMLGRLREALRFRGASGDVSKLQGSVRSFTLAPMVNGVSGVSRSFLALSAVGLTVISELTRSAMQLGGRLGRALSLDGVTSGFQEYELNMRSIQTILANTSFKGSTLEDVNNALDELNAYADLTIYNFAEMTRNIGTFTAAGVDLETSTQSIKGIANLAAISGSSSQQASNAMYQLSQAISTGSLRLMDWNSVVNAGMGGEVFQRALFETGKAMGTINDVPLEQTFDDWKEAGNSFRGSLEKEWITADVLTTTLRGFTGELTEAQLLSIGYTKEQAKAIQEMGQTGVDAATKVRTLTQLIDTTKEAIQSGWSQSFRLVLGDFEEATELFSGIASGLSEMVEESANSRNELLKQWDSMGGRTELIKALGEAVKNLGIVFGTVKETFRNIFPKTTSIELVLMTRRFSRFVETLKPSKSTLLTIKGAFTGFFSVIKIAKTIVSETFGFIMGVFDRFAPRGQTVARLVHGIGFAIKDLSDRMVEGGGIAEFFDVLNEAIDNPKEAISVLIEGLKNLFAEFESVDMDKVNSSLEEAKLYLENFVSAVTAAVDKVKGYAAKIKGYLDQAWAVVEEWFERTKKRLADAEISLVDTAVDFGIIGVLSLLVYRLSKLISNITGAVAEGGEVLETLTGALKAMQNVLRSETLLNIAKAVAILAGSAFLLSLIEPDTLDASLKAIGVGLIQLTTVLFALSKFLFNPKTAAAFLIATLGMISLSVALVTFAAAVKIFALMSDDTFNNGLKRTAASLGVLVAAIKLLGKHSAGLFAAGAGIMLIGVALNLIAASFHIFAMMDLEALAKGLGSMGAALFLIMQIVGKTDASQMMAKGAGIALIGVGLNFIALAMHSLGKLSWKEMGVGLISIAGSLAAITAAAVLIPKGFIFTALSIVVFSGAMLVLGEAIKSMASLTWDQLTRGLAGFTGAVFGVVIAANLMRGTMKAALSFYIVSQAFEKLAQALMLFSVVPIRGIVVGVGTLAGILYGFVTLASTIGVKALPGLLGLAAGLTALGAATLLIGFGIKLLGEGLGALVKAGVSGIKVLVFAIVEIMKLIPEFVSAAVLAFGEFMRLMVDLAPEIAQGISTIVRLIFDALSEILPLLLSTLADALKQFAAMIINSVPNLAVAAVVLIRTIVDTIRENIGYLVASGFEIVIAFLEGVVKGMPDLIARAASTVFVFLAEITKQLPELIKRGAEFLREFLVGIKSETPTVVAHALDVIVAFLQGVESKTGDLVNAGLDILVAFLKGIANNIPRVVSAVIDILEAFLRSIASNLGRLIDAGGDVLVAFVNGISRQIGKLTTAVADLIIAFVASVVRNTYRITGAAVDLIIEFTEALANQTIRLADAAFTILTDFLNELADVIENRTPELIEAGVNVAKAIVKGMTKGIADAASNVAQSAVDMAKGALGAVSGFLGINSPSKKFIEIGESVAEGLVVALRRDKTAQQEAEDLSRRVNNSFAGALTGVQLAAQGLDGYSPVITPVVDMSNIGMARRSLRGLVPSGTIDISQQRVSARNTASNVLSAARTRIATAEATGSAVNFNQVINSPDPITPAAVYKAGVNALRDVRTELNIPELDK